MKHRRHNSRKGLAISLTNFEKVSYFVETVVMGLVIVMVVLN